MRAVRTTMFAVTWLAVLPPTLTAAATVYETRGAFVKRAFEGDLPQTRLFWVKGDEKARVAAVLGHPYPALRLRYWCRKGRSAWILDEIGKELPITVGVVVESGRIKSLRVLTYRENRGGEVSAPAFTDQFDGVSLRPDDTLDGQIDGISGATLSVRALTRLARLALLLHVDSGCAHGAQE